MAERTYLCITNDARTGHISSSMGKRGKARKARVHARLEAEWQAAEDEFQFHMNQIAEDNAALERFWTEQQELAIAREQQMSTWAKFKRWLVI